ncbi:MAG: hypothetical protein MK137_00365 [Rickettsiales bacterium]|nr:hypothetical protein [Rickettsiales bacterium]
MNRPIIIVSLTFALYGIGSNEASSHLRKQDDSISHEQRITQVMCKHALKLHGFCIKELSGIHGTPYNATRLEADGRPFVFGGFHSHKQTSLMLYPEQATVMPKVIHSDQEVLRKRFVQIMKLCQKGVVKEEALDAAIAVLGYNLSGDTEEDIYVVGVKNLYTLKIDKHFIAAFKDGVMIPDISSNEHITCETTNN